MHQECQADYNALRRQLKALDRFNGDPARWQALLERLVSDTKLPSSPDGTYVVLLQGGPCEPPVPVVAGELIVGIDADRADEVDQILAKFRFAPVDSTEAELEVLPIVRRYRSDPLDVDLLPAIAEVKRQVPTAQISPNSLRVMNVVTKSKSGAEPACCFPDPVVSEVDCENGNSPYVIVLDTGKFLDGHRADWLKDVGGDDDPRLDEKGYLNLSAGHGTFIAGVVRQVCSPAWVDVKQVLGQTGFAQDSDLATEIGLAGEKLRNHDGGGVINISLGWDEHEDAPPGVEQALRDLPPRVVVVGAAGNVNSGKKVYPAAFSEQLDYVVAVASLDRHGLPSTWSNRGDWINFSAIGEGIVSTYLEGREKAGSSAEDDPYDPEPDVWVGPRPWAVWSGTSFAAPQISARIAEILAQNQELSAAAAVQALRDQIDEGAELPGFGLPLPQPENLSVVQEPTRDDAPQP